MTSIVSGFEYDIFISYRQKDNKGNRWVSEFVEALKTELESTFKEEVSVYFDINPHDGLLETHDVDSSLKEKLKCLVFIPIISQTFCDSKSFAWQHEFCVFNKFAKEDQFGRDIRLAGGNVASRILPVKIHDLDEEDKKLLENELGGVLRSIEFIYKSAGVNRPLRANEDHPQDNLNKTYYRDQINKVANAIKEIITSIKKQNRNSEDPSKEVFKEQPSNHKYLSIKTIAGLLLLLLLVAAGLLFIPKIFRPPEQLEKSLAVLPFINDSPGDSNTFFINGLMEEILIDLQAIKEFRVPGRTSSEQYRNNSTKSNLEIAREMGVNYIVEGSGQKSGNTFRIRVQLIRAKGKEANLWAKSYEQEIHGTKDIFKIQTQIAQAIAAELKAAITPDVKTRLEKTPTENLEAYSYFLQGNEFFWRNNNPDSLKKAVELYEKAIELDPKFSLAYARLSIGNSRIYSFISINRTKDRLTKSKSALDSVLKFEPDLPEAHLALGAYYYDIERDFPKALKEIESAENMLPNNSDCAYYKGLIYRRSGKWELGKESLVRAFELDPGSAVIANATGQTLSRMREFPAAEFYLKKAIINNPSYTEPYFECALVYLRSDGDTSKARNIIEAASKVVDSESRYFIWQKIQIDIYTRNYQKALNDLSLLDNDPDYGASRFYYTSLFYATIYNFTNQKEKAYFYFNSARKLLESTISKDTDMAWFYMGYLGIAYAGLGQKKEAIEIGKKGAEISLFKDTNQGPRGIENLAKIYVMTGEYDAALEQIKLLFSIPSMMNVPMLLLDLTWKPLWELPEFKKIVETYSEK